MGCSRWALDRGMDGTEERKTLVVGKTAGKFLEGWTVARGGWGMAVEEGWWHSFPAAAAATCGGGSGGVGLTAWVEREQSKGRRQSRRRHVGGGGVPSPLIEPILGRERKGPT